MISLNPRMDITKLPSFILSVALIVIIILVAMLFPVFTSDLLNHVKDTFISEYGFITVWFAGACLLIQGIFLFTKYGNIKIARAEDHNPTPKYNNWGYWSMIFSNGMGVSIIFWAVLEPVIHQQEGLDLTENMVRTFHNWGYGAWSFYGILGIAFGYLIYNRDKFLPINKLFNSTINNILCVSVLCASTVIGLAISFLYMTGVIVDGFHDYLSMNISPIAVIIGTTACTMLSAYLGIDRGIKVVSSWNIVVAIVLVLTTYIGYYSLSNLFIDTLKYLGIYTIQEPVLLLEVGSDPEKAKWLANWPYNYFPNWLGWSIYVGMFIAKISYGRTLREVVIGSVIVPTVFSAFWFTVFGQSALLTESETIFELVNNVVPYGILSIIIMVSCVLFFITGHDSAGIVLELLTLKNTKLFWILLMSVLAISMVLLPGDSVDLLRSLITVTAIPMLLIVSVIIYKFIKEFYSYEKINSSSTL